MKSCIAANHVPNIGKFALFNHFRLKLTSIDVNHIVISHKYPFYKCSQTTKIEKSNKKIILQNMKKWY